MKAIILAGGKGTRLYPLTYTYPKGMIPMVNRPFLEHQIEFLKAHGGIRNIILSLNFMAEPFQRLLGDGSRLGVNITYVTEREPLGTGGAVKNCKSLIEDDPFLVMNGDILTDVDLTELVSFHRRKAARATLTLVRVDDPTSYGLVITDAEDRVTEFLEKPGWGDLDGTADTINAGIAVFSPEILDYIPEGEASLEREVYPVLAREKGSLFGFVTDRYWLDIGTLDRYLKAHIDILEGNVSARPYGQRQGNGVYIARRAAIHRTAWLLGPVAIGDEVKIGAWAKVGPGVTLGKGTIIEEGATIVESVFHEEVKAGRKSCIRRSIIASGCEIGEGCVIEGAVLGPASKVSPGSRLGLSSGPF